MPNIDNLCEYEFDPDDPTTWNGEKGDTCYIESEVLNKQGVWNCPYISESDEKLCIFHRKASKTDDKAVRDAFLEEVRNPTGMDQVARFIGAQFGTLDLSEVSLSNTTVEQIDLRHTTFNEAFEGSEMEIRADLALDGSKIKQTLSLDGADINEFSFDGATCDNDINCRRANITNQINLSNANVDGSVNFEQAERVGGVSLRETHIQGGLFLNGAYSDSEVNINMSIIEHGFGCLDSTIEDDVKLKNGCYVGEEGTGFNDTDVEGSIEIINSHISGDLDADRTEVTDDIAIIFTEIDGSVSFEDCNVEEKIVFGESSITGGYVFTDSYIGGGLTLEEVDAAKTSFRNAQIKGGNFQKSRLPDSDFSEGSLINCDFQEARLDHSDFEQTDLSHTNLERAKLSGSDLFGANLSGAKMYGVQIGDAVVNTDTTFDEYGEDRCIYDPNSGYKYEQSEDEMIGQLRKAMGTYHMFEQLARANTLPDKQARFFVRRQDVRRSQLYQDESFPRLNYRFSQAQNAVFRYGESFARVVLWSVGIVILFSFIYPLGGWLRSESGPATYSAIVDTPVLMWKVLHHSALQFLAGTGPLEPANVVGEVLVTIQTAVAPVLIALLVFVLGRRAAR